MKSHILLTALISVLLQPITANAASRNAASVKPRVIISTDIGGTDPDDNQSLAHLFFYTDKIDLEGIISSPSFGNGSADEVRRMISVYAKDYATLRKAYPGLMSPKALRRITKQGHRGLFAQKGYDEPTEGSKWIVRQARKSSSRPLWILVWGSLEDVAQALHDAPDIAKNIRVYYIGGPNKMWGLNSYAYIAENFPELWIIENNSTYRGFITDTKKRDQWNRGFYDYAIKGRGHLGADFAAYYKGVVKMGDSPSLFYLLDGDPEDPTKPDCRGGSFVPLKRSHRQVFSRQLTVNDTVPVYSIVELRLKAPAPDNADTATSDAVKPALTIRVNNQNWAGEYLGDGVYSVRYAPKAPAHLTYTISSVIPELDGLHGEFIVSRSWPGHDSPDDYLLGDNWYTDNPNPSLFDGHWQGAETTKKHRNEVLEDWKERMDVLRTGE